MDADPVYYSRDLLASNLNAVKWRSQILIHHQNSYLIQICSFPYFSICYPPGFPIRILFPSAMGFMSENSIFLFATTYSITHSESTANVLGDWSDQPSASICNYTEQYWNNFRSGNCLRKLARVLSQYSWNSGKICEQYEPNPKPRTSIGDLGRWLFVFSPSKKIT